MWEERDNKLCKIFIFKDFNEAFGFMTRAAMIIEQLNHHPTWSNTWNTVAIELCTHDAGNIVTQRDKDLATALDQLV